MKNLETLPLRYILYRYVLEFSDEESRLYARQDEKEEIEIDSFLEYIKNYNYKQQLLTTLLITFF